MCDAVYSYTSAELRELPLNTVMTGRHGDVKQQQDGNLHFTAHVDIYICWSSCVNREWCRAIYVLFFRWRLKSLNLCHPSLGIFPHCSTFTQDQTILKEVVLLCIHKQEAQLSPRDRAMRCVNWNLANCHATVQKLLIWQVLAKLMVWSWGFSRRQCVIDNVHSTMTRPSRFHLSQMCHKQTDDGRLVDITCIPTTCCGEIF